ncbi:MAG: hypothetical protein O7E52_21580 [Candidatus Poribacteria bacterium]|nr:hypothetical protein [Candidatus Poribacteria bacterium]
MDWGDTFGLGLGAKNDKYLLIWTPKKSSEGQILPVFDSEDGKLTLKMKARPGAWISWIDEARIAAEATDDHDRVRKSVQELERNARQVTDFADGVLKDITTLHLGKSLTLPELAQEVLNVEFTVPTSIKTGGYVLASSEDTSDASAKVVIPEQTNIQHIHMNEDELFESVATGAYDRLFVVYRTHVKRYPDLLDLSYCLTLSDYLQGKSAADEIVSSVPCLPAHDLESVQVLPTAAVYDPLHPDRIEFVVTELQASHEAIREAITECSSVIDQYMAQANQRARDVMANFQARIDSRLQALTLQPGQRIYEKVWDDLAINELRNRMFEFIEFFGKYLGEHFDEDETESRKDLLKRSIDPILEAWQLQDLRQTTIRHLILSGYKLANQVLDRATGLFYDSVFEKYFIEKELLRTVDLLVLENGELLEPVSLPEWTEKTVRDRLHRFALNAAIHPKQIERHRKLWMELLELGNFVSRHQQQFEAVLKPLADILLMPKQPETGSASAEDSGSRNISLRRRNTFEGFEVSDQVFDAVLSHLKDNFSIIKRWMQEVPGDRAKRDQYYATLWMILTDGKIREVLRENFEPICEINLSLPLETKRLIDLVLGGKIIIRNERDLNTLKRHMDRALNAKTGRGLQEIATPAMLRIHSDTLLCLLREELLTYQQSLDKQLVRITNPKPQKRSKTKKKRRKNIPAESIAETVAAIEEEKPKIAEVIEFLNTYTDAPSALLETAMNPSSQQINQIRKHQVLNFDLQSLPPIEDTWLEGVKSPDDYPNLRAFLFENKLPISTSGRVLMKLRRTFPQVSASQGSSANPFDVAVDLVLELKALQDAAYEGDTLKRFISYISEKLWRWELTQITEAELPTLIKEKVLSSAICYEKEVEALLEYVERYEQLSEAKLAPDSEMGKQGAMLEANFQELAETLL